ncbi:MAG TPA: hypothetical protein EYO01_03260 [Phycisphaerales bacterium]|nr:hypothetical protein [Phycisphaerales bacterium]
MQVVDTLIPEVKIIEPEIFGDSRGFFIESYNTRVFEALLQPQNVVLQPRNVVVIKFFAEVMPPGAVVVIIGQINICSYLIVCTWLSSNKS